MAAQIACTQLPVTVVSGDCLIGPAVLAGAQRTGADPALVWFDAHGDVHTLATSTSGYPGGLALRLAMGANPELLATPLALRPVPPHRVTLVGARDLDPAEAAYLAESPVKQVAVAAVQAPAGPFIVHVDVDVADPGEVAGLRYPAPGGVATSEVVAAVRRLTGTGRVVALSVACTWKGGVASPAVSSAALPGAALPGRDEFVAALVAAGPR
ncbi:arginase family protein [Actinoplanes sp. TFC3]|uniref:arginase family protein n=1 Tax=Actinoplanes sp. TFC3 TaxID=1710355 RepID=UPI00082C9C71|nr:arginase family protein [Actinoplanes sp. TFC3]